MEVGKFNGGIKKKEQNGRKFVERGGGGGGGCEIRCHAWCHPAHPYVSFRRNTYPARNKLSLWHVIAGHEKGLPRLYVC